MTIEITRPEVEALIQQRLRSGAFKNAEDVILHALRSSDENAGTGRDFAEQYPLQAAANLILQNMRNVPQEIMAAMPEDGASEHDHYIYGWPKREA